MRWALALASLLTACGSTATPSEPSEADGSVDDDIDAAATVPDAGPAPPPDAIAPTDAPPAAPDPAAAGEWDVHASTDSVTTELGTAAVTVYSPSDGGGMPAAGPFPLVVVSTGFQIGRTNYDGTCRHLASWGYVVVSHDYTSGNHQAKAAELGELIDWAIADLDHVDADRIAVAGHSLGGKVSINATILDARIDAVIGWDPVDALPPLSDGSTSVTPQLMDGLTVPIVVLGETTDAGNGGGGMSCAPSADNYVRYFEAACEAPTALEVTIAGADHTDWVDQRSACGFACLFCGNGTTADATTREITRRVTTAWLEVHLRDRDELVPYLTSPGAPATVRAVVPGC